MQDPKSYWDRRLKNFCNLEGVGCVGRGRLLNTYLYKAKVRTLEKISKRLGFSFTGKDILDIGSGIGFWIDYYSSKGANTIYGVDISSIAIKYLTEKYGSCDRIKLFEGDFSHLDLNRRFNIVNAFDVAYHVVDDKLFSKFAENLCKHLKDGGFLFVSDAFRQDYRDTSKITDKCRSLDDYRKILERCEVEIITVAPMYSILGYPFTGKCRLDRVLSLLHHYSTRFYESFKPSIKLAYHVDSFLTQFSIFGISTKLLVGRKQKRTNR